MQQNLVVLKFHLSYDVTYDSGITLCIKIGGSYI